MLFGMWIAGYWPMSDFWSVLKAWLGILAEFLGVFTRITYPPDVLYYSQSPVCSVSLRVTRVFCISQCITGNLHKYFHKNKEINQ